MDSLSTGRVAEVLERLYREAEAADRPMMEAYMAAGVGPEQLIARVIEAEAKDLRGLYRAHADHLAAALRDLGGGRLIGTELEPGKAARARANLEAAGLADLVTIRQGDALETLEDVDDEIDLVMLDGAFSLYPPVLKLLEPHLKPGALILAENAFEQAGGYLAYVRDPANGYLSQPISIGEGRGNEFTLVT